MQEILINELRHKISILKNIEIEDQETGFITNQKMLMISCWAKINRLNSNISGKFLKYSTEITHEIIIRYITNISIQDEIIFETRIFKIVEIINLEERNTFLRILAKENIN